MGHRRPGRGKHCGEGRWTAEQRRETQRAVRLPAGGAARHRCARGPDPTRSTRPCYITFVGPSPSYLTVAASPWGSETLPEVPIGDTDGHEGRARQAATLQSPREWVRCNLPSCRRSGEAFTQNSRLGGPARQPQSREPPPPSGDHGRRAHPEALQGARPDPTRVLPGCSMKAGTGPFPRFLSLASRACKSFGATSVAPGGTPGAETRTLRRSAGTGLPRLPSGNTSDLPLPADLCGAGHQRHGPRGAFSSSPTLSPGCLLQRDPWCPRHPAWPGLPLPEPPSGTGRSHGPSRVPVPAPVFPVMFFGPTVRARPLPHPLPHPQHGRGLSDATRESSRGSPPPGPTPDNSSCLGPLTYCARGRIAEPITP